jgi:hypothetical protein
MSQSALFTDGAGRPAPAATEPTRAVLHMEVVTVDLPGGRCLRLACVDGVLLISDGFQDDDALRSIGRGLAIPLAAWPAVRAELDRLAGS